MYTHRSTTGLGKGHWFGANRVGTHNRLEWWSVTHIHEPDTVITHGIAPGKALVFTGQVVGSAPVSIQLQLLVFIFQAMNMGRCSGIDKVPFRGRVDTEAANRSPHVLMPDKDFQGMGIKHGEDRFFAVIVFQITGNHHAIG